MLQPPPFELGQQPIGKDGQFTAIWRQFLLNQQAAVADNSGAPYLTYTSDPNLDNAFNLGALSSGLLYLTVALGTAVPSTVPYSQSTYTPTLTGVANVTASTAYACQYTRLGSQVLVSGKVDIDPTAGATLTQLGISLPIPSNFGAAEQCAGTAAAPVPAYSGAVVADVANDRAELQFTTAADVANRSWWFVFSYQVR